MFARNSQGDTSVGERGLGQKARPLTFTKNFFSLPSREPQRPPRRPAKRLAGPKMGTELVRWEEANEVEDFTGGDILGPVEESLELRYSREDCSIHVLSPNRMDPRAPQWQAGTQADVRRYVRYVAR